MRSRGLGSAAAHKRNMSQLFYQKYRRLFFEDDTEPLAYQIYHSQPSHVGVSELPQWLNSAASRPFPDPLPKPAPKVRLPPIEHSPPPQTRKALPADPLPKPPRQLSPLKPVIDSIDQPRRPMLQYDPTPYESPETRVEKPTEYVPKPSIKVMPKTEDTRERVFPKAGSGSVPAASPYQVAVQRRKEAKRNLEPRREALRRLLKV